MTVTGTTFPSSSKIWVIPTLRPRIPLRPTASGAGHDRDRFIVAAVTAIMIDLSPTGRFLACGTASDGRSDSTSDLHLAADVAPEPALTLETLGSGSTEKTPEKAIPGLTRDAVHACRAACS
ncbi:MAG: hypothetical protein ACKO35_01590 [Planctomycetaceae bacterium]